MSGDGDETAANEMTDGAMIIAAPQLRVIARLAPVTLAVSMRDLADLIVSKLTSLAPMRL